MIRVWSLKLQEKRIGSDSTLIAAPSFSLMPNEMVFQLPAHHSICDTRSLRSSSNDLALSLSWFKSGLVCASRKYAACMNGLLLVYAQQSFFGINLLDHAVRLHLLELGLKETREFLDLGLQLGLDFANFGLSLLDVLAQAFGDGADVDLGQLLPVGEGEDLKLTELLRSLLLELLEHFHQLVSVLHKLRQLDAHGVVTS